MQLNVWNDLAKAKRRWTEKIRKATYVDSFNRNIRRDLDTLLLRFKDESFTGSVFRSYPFRELSLQQVRQNSFQIF